MKIQSKLIILVILISIIGSYFIYSFIFQNKTITSTIINTTYLKTTQTITKTELITKIINYTLITTIEKIKINTIFIEPIKIINDKIYDLRITFKASSQYKISYAEIKWVPIEYYYMIEKYKMRKEDYNKVFPLEENKTFILIPKDGKFDNLEEEFEIMIKDIIGGREYKILFLVKDEVGNVVIKEIKIPYIREFENFGKQLHEKGMIIAAVYYPLYPDPHPWEALEPMAVHPLLGKYDVRDPIIVAKHIDWATGHGINTFVFSWGTDDNVSTKKIHENILAFLSVPLSNQIKIGIFYELPSRLRAGGIYPDNMGLYHLDDPEKWKKVIEDIRLLNSSLFSRENYLKIGSKPVVEFYETALVGKVAEFVKDVKREACDFLFIISHHAHPWSATSAYTDPPSGGWIEGCDASGYCDVIEYAKNFDGWGTWVAGWYTPVKEPLNENYPKFLEEGYKVWSRLAKKYGKMLVPSITPGFITLRDSNFPRLPRSAEMFKKELEVAFKYATPVNGTKIIKIDTYNEFGEATGIEPTKEERLIYFQTIKSFLEVNKL